MEEKKKKKAELAASSTKQPQNVATKPYSRRQHLSTQMKLELPYLGMVSPAEKPARNLTPSTLF